MENPNESTNIMEKPNVSLNQKGGNNDIINNILNKPFIRHIFNSLSTKVFYTNYSTSNLSISSRIFSYIITIIKFVLIEKNINNKYSKFITVGFKRHDNKNNKKMKNDNGNDNNDNGNDNGNYNGNGNSNGNSNGNKKNGKNKISFKGLLFDLITSLYLSYDADMSNPIAKLVYTLIVKLIPICILNHIY